MHISKARNRLVWLAGLVVLCAAPPISAQNQAARRADREDLTRCLVPQRGYVAAEKIGQETVTYVSNLYKYYIAYRLILESQEARQEALEKVKSEQQ